MRELMMADEQNQSNQGQPGRQQGQDPAPATGGLYPYPTALPLAAFSTLSDFARGGASGDKGQAAHAAWEVAGWGLGTFTPGGGQPAPMQAQQTGRPDMRAFGQECDRIVSDARQKRGAGGPGEMGFDVKSIRWDIILPALIQILQGFFG
jgi:hypothetical protein